MKPWPLLLALLLVSPAWGCDLRQRAQAYFDVYAQRTDFEALMAFYAEDAVLEDRVTGHHAQGRGAIRAFLDWSRGGFAVQDGGPALVLERLQVTGHIALAQGQFRPFRYQGQPLGPWRFTMRLTFDERGRIRHQSDWIAYPPSLLGPPSHGEAR
ncbi:nuclear transport factor 2 family protein [Ferrimonas balearica]|uniref:nuclear transport factor 2 family protein n=1 Tax=Ferrimonas balearica TaxID=44012 RepID=UPI001C9920D2|nr:nuclear transport factor 2 family protein [Ferrimonas balearica]MBY5993170.1 nuclear transport factor 2 family protein [Ferrimonas balearica]